VSNTPIPFEPKSIEFKIDGLTYTKKELLVTERNILLFKIAQLLGASGAGLGNLDDNIDFGKMLAGVLYKYTPEAAAAFVKETIMAGLEYPKFDHSSKDPGQPNYENHFTQYYTHQMEVLQEIWEQNFGESMEQLKKKLTTFKPFMLMLSMLKFQEESQDRPEPDSTTKSP